MFARYPLSAAERGGSSYSIQPAPFPDATDIVGATRSNACILFTGVANARSIARRIHDASGWRWGDFEEVDCRSSEAVLNDRIFDVIESDLWPVGSDVPVLRLLQPGTIFLQDVGELPRRAQARLRDLLEASATGRSGRRARRRIMASTPEPLLGRVSDGTFDETLYYRLNAIHFVRPGGPAY